MEYVVLNPKRRKTAVKELNLCEISRRYITDRRACVVANDRKEVKNAIMFKIDISLLNCDSRTSLRIPVPSVGEMEDYTHAPEFSSYCHLL